MSLDEYERASLESLNLMTGVCKLCLKPKELQDSHFIPAAMYKYARDPDVTKKNRNPVLVTAKATITTSKQITDYVLCACCEDLFNKNGESWMLKQVWNGKRFPLRDRLGAALPLQHYTLANTVAFSGAATGIDTDKLGYFALSVIWRAGVHQWDIPLVGKTTVLNIGTVEEPMRQFLLGEAAFPTNVAILAAVCTDPYSRGLFYRPAQTTGLPGTSFVMLTLGVHFMVFTGDSIPPILRQMCCVKSAAKVIFQRDCSQKALEAYAQLMNQRPIPTMGK
jgi:hypothetical protein